MELEYRIAKNRTGFVSKLPTYEKLAIISNNSKMFESLNAAGTSGSVKEAPLRGHLVRRSKSSIDLKVIHHKSLNKERLPTIEAKKMLVPNNVQQLKTVPLKNTTNVDLVYPMNKLKSRRRSKSVTNLIQDSLKSVGVNDAKKFKYAPKTLENYVKTKTTVTNKNTNLLLGMKRTILDNKSAEQPKAKVMKPARIPAYDYKSRFQHLEGLHLKLKVDHEELQNNFSVYKEDQADFINQRNQLRATLDILENDKLNAHEEINSLKAANNNIKLENNKLFKEIESSQIEIQNKKVKIESLQISFEKVTEDFRCLSKESVNLTKRNNHIHAENEQIKLKVEELNLKVEKRDLQIVELKAELENKDVVRQKLHNDIQDLKGNIRVFCRVRPQIRNEDKFTTVIKCWDNTEIEIRKLTQYVSAVTGRTAEVKQEFSFDRVFDENSTQADIFMELSELVQSALDGYNVCVFAYGQTGSGKTYTMQGYDADDEGMIPRSLRVIFNYGEKKKNLGWSFAIQASFLEIYNESLNDLLNIKNKEHLDICYNEGKGVSVKHLTIQSVETYKELGKLMAIAHKNRTVAATDFNLHSSRSHAVTQIHITALNLISKTKLTSTINLVDLAGSESAKTSSLERLTETKSINKSLSTLGTVMNDLGAGKIHIPYRNSKLTFLLQSCLGGNSKTLMVVHISPNDECYNESVSSLRFAAKVKSIKTLSRKNKTLV